MKISIQSILNLLVAAYNAFLKGRTIHVGGQDVVLPNQRPGAFPAGQSPLDSVPHKPGGPK